VKELGHLYVSTLELLVEGYCQEVLFPWLSDLLHAGREELWGKKPLRQETQILSHEVT
jgi:hypothetical protein